MIVDPHASPKTTTAGSTRPHGRAGRISWRIRQCSAAIAATSTANPVSIESWVRRPESESATARIGIRMRLGKTPK